MASSSIIIADSDYLVRVGLQHLIRRSKGFEIVAEAQSENDLIKLLKENHSDIVILDYNQQDAFGIETIRRINKISPKSKLLIISADNSKKNVFEVLELGVNSFLTKQCEEEEIINAIKAVSKGEKFFCNNVLNLILEKSFSPEETDDCSPTPLTFREMQIVKLITAGKIAKEIADVLNLSVHTVYTHRKNIMKKLELSSTSELVIYAINHGIIESNPTST
jgi:DNA-binding NarL/FixJ family response regulator